MIKLKNYFTSKADVLKILKPKIKKSKIEKIYDFTVDQWNSEQSAVMTMIKEQFPKGKLIVRSSTLGEDSVDYSYAGNYESILNVPTLSKNKIQKAINSVIKSYNDKGNFNGNNQVLIQNQTHDIQTSGVIFTKTSDSGAPYYVINFEEGSSTVGVTKGTVSNTVKLFRNSPITLIPKRWRKLIDSIQEIESIINSNILDIEFGITKNKTIVIFQVRPITSLVEYHNKKTDEKIFKLIKKISTEFLTLSRKKHIPGNSTIFSDMADWNPAEIIGNNPNMLDYSLYDFLIMKKIWHQSRSVIGYQNIKLHQLMVKLGNKPYVDVRASFNSLIPQNISLRLKKKLMKYYLNKLNKNHHLHDKVEFEILFTCYDLTIDNRLKELKQYGFTNDEIQEIKDALINFTNEIINKFPKILYNCQKSINHLSVKRNNIILNLHLQPKTYKNLLSAAEQLLFDCRKFGALPFSTMARISFISSILLKSLQTEKILSKHFIENFMNSLSTPLSEIQNDVEKLSKKKISKNQFLEKYGHLRPGTYDITASRYDMEAKFFDNVKFLKKKSVHHVIRNNNNLTKLFVKNGLKFSKIDFFTFVKESITQRENLKFEFTKNLSQAIELIAKAGTELGFSREDMSHLTIETILSYNNLPKKLLKQKWTKLIDSEKKRFNRAKFLVLPPILFSKNDFYFIQYFISKPNFITSKEISGDIINLKHFEEQKFDLENKIVLIENADPGYDWIFTRNPLGLITKYGGVASHMSIRCAEVGLPAAIGCGEILYEQLLSSSEILLDSKNKQIIILEHKENDEYIEERKVLKSLGYIK